MASATPAHALDIVIRFSTSHQDLILSLPQPHATTALGFKQRIRAELPAPASESRLRLIHAGKVISDQDALSRSLGVAAPPPSSQLRSHEAQKSDKASGKLPARESERARRVYIHCSIGDTLSPSELAEEKKTAEEADAALLSNAPPRVLGIATDNAQSGSGMRPTATTGPAPQGFDRLLAAGFTPAEIAGLRSQFLAIQAHTHTPDHMPSGPELQALEEQWLEQSNSGAAPGSGMDDAAGDDGLDDMLWGSLVGFFWPIGVMCWLMREEGVWSRRRQTLVLVGFFMNLAFGLLRLLG